MVGTMRRRWGPCGAYYGTLDAAASRNRAQTTRDKSLSIMTVLLVPTVALLMLDTAVLCSAFCPPDKLLASRRIGRSQHDIPPKFVWGPDFHPHQYRINEDNPSAYGRSTSSTIPPPQRPNESKVVRTATATLPAAQNVDLGTCTSATVPPADRPTPAELAKRFIELSQQRLKSIVVKGLTEEDDNQPSMQDLYTTTQKVKSAMREKERLFGEIISQQRNQYVEVERRLRAWQGHYNESLATIQDKVRQQEAEMEIKTAMHESQLESLRSSYARQEEAARSTIVRLTSEIESIQVESQRRHMEAAAHLQSQQAQLKQRVHDLETKLESQLAQAQVDAAKYTALHGQRQKLKGELESVQRDFAGLLHKLEAQLLAERALREDERAKAQQQLESVTKQTEHAYEAARLELVKLHQAEREALTNETNSKHEKKIEQLEQRTQAEQSRLTYSLETTRAQLLQLQNSHVREVEQERSKTTRIESTLQNEIKSLEAQIKQLECEKLDGETKRVQELMKHCASLEQQLAGLQQQYDKTVSSMESKYTSLLDQRAKEQQQYSEVLTKEREDRRQKLDAAYREMQVVQESVGRNLKEKQEQFHSAIKELRDLSNQTEANLKANLLNLNDSMQRQQTEANGRLLEVQRTAMAQQQALQRIIAKKDQEIQSLSLRAKEEYDRAVEHQQKRAELENELRILRERYEGAQQSWEVRYRDLESLLTRERATTEERIAAMELRARQDLAHAHKARSDLEASLEIALKTKDSSHEDRIRLVTAAAQAKEKELADELERLQQDWSQFKIESHKQLEEEREKSKAVQKELQSKIVAKEREIEEASTMAELESQRATEFLQKRRELEEELLRYSTDYDAALETWEQVTRSFEASRRNEQRAAVEFIAQKEADVVRQVIETLEEASSHKEWFETALRERERQFAAQLEEARNTSRQREAGLLENVSKLSQELHDAKLETIRSASVARSGSSHSHDELVTALARKDEELERQRVEAARRAEEAQELNRQQRELRNEMSQLRLLHAQSIAEMEARHARVVQSHDDEKREAAAKIRQAVSTVRSYEAVLSSSLEHMGDLEGHLQSEVERLQRMVSTLQGRRAVSP